MACIYTFITMVIPTIMDSNPIVNYNNKWIISRNKYGKYPIGYYSWDHIYR